MSSQGRYSILVEVRGAQEAGQQFKTLADSLTQVDSRVKQSSNTLNQAGQNFQRLGQQVQSSNTPLQTFSQNVGTTQQRSQQLVSSQSALGNAFRQTATATQGAQGSLTQYNTLLGNTGQQTLTLRQRLGELGSSLAGVAGSFTGVIGSATILFQTLTSLRDAEYQLNRSNLQVEFRQQRVAVRLAYVNKLMAEGKEGTEQYALAVSQLGLTKNRLKLALEANSKAQETFNIQQLNFAGTVGPAVMTMVGSITAAVSQLTAKNAEGVSGIGRIGAAFSNLISPAGGATTALGGLTSGIGSFMAVLAPAALAVAAFVAALKTIEGIQSTFDAFAAKAEGDLGRVQMSFENMIDSFNEAVVIGAGPKDFLRFFELLGIEVSTSEKEVQASLDRMSTNWNDTLADMQQSGNILGETLGNIGVLLSDAFAGLPLLAADISKAFSDIGPQIMQSFGDLGALFQRNVADPIVSGFQNLPASIGALGQDIVTALGLEEIVSWAQSNVIPGIVNAFQSIAGMIGPVGEQIVQSLGLEQVWQFAVETANTVVDAFMAIPNAIGGLGAEIQKALGFKPEEAKPIEIEGPSFIQSGLESMGKGLEQVTGFVQKQIPEIRTLTKSNEGLSQSQEEVGESAESTAEDQAALDQVMKDAEAARKEMLSGIKEVNKELESGAIAKQAKELQELTRSNNDLEVALSTTKFAQDAFNKGQEEQRQKLLQSKTALLETAGQLQVYREQVESGEAGNIAFIQGVQKQEKALLDSVVALGETRGQLETYAQQLDSGEQFAVAFAEGQNKVKQAFLDSGRSIADLSGLISQYDQMLADGTIQTVAFAEGLQRGALSAREWAVELQSSAAEQEGFRQGLLDVATIMNVEIPNAAAKSAESIQELLSLDTLAGAQALDAQFSEIANSLFESMVKGAEEGREGAREVFEKLPDDIRDALPEEIETEMVIKADTAKSAEHFIQGFGIAMQVGGVTAAQEFSRNFLDELEDDVRNDPDGAVAAMQPLIDAVQQIAIDPTNLQNWRTLMGYLQSLSPEAREMVEAFAEAQGIDLSTLSNDIMLMVDPTKTIADNAREMADQLERAGKAAGDFTIQQAGGFERAMALLKEQESRETTRDEGGQVPTGPATAAPVIDTNPAKAAMDELLTYTTNIMNQIAQTGQHVSTVWGGHFNTAVQTASGHMNTLLTNTINVMNQVAQTAQHVATIWNGHFNTATQNAAGVMNTLVQHATTQMTAVGNTASTVATAWTTHFNTATQNAAGVINTLLTHAQTQMTAIGNTAASVASTWTTHFNTATQNAAGVMNNLLTHAVNTMNQVAETARHVETTWTAAFNRIGSVVEGVMQRIASAMEGVISVADRVAQSIARIGDAAEQARQQVDQLSTTIQNIPDGEAVIRVRYDIPPAPPGVVFGGGFGGFGGGSPGTGFGSGAPITGGGGPGEPSLQFQAQGGIGNWAKEFNKLGILAPLLIDHPTKITVGESGPELVSVTPVNRYRHGRTGELSPFVDKRSGRPLAAQGGLGEFHTMNEGGPTGGLAGVTTINLTNGNVVFKDNAGPIQIISGGAGAGIGTGLPTTGGFGNTNIGLGTGQGGIFNVPGGQGMVSGNATVCINGQCFGNTQGLGAPIGTMDQQQLGQEQGQGFQPVFDEQGMIKAIETLVEWFKFLGLPTGASVPGTANFTPGGIGQQQAGLGAFAGGPINMTGGNINFDANQGDMELRTSTGTIAITGPGGAFAQSGRAMAGVGLFGGESLEETQERRQLNQINQNLENIGDQLGQQNQEFNQFQQQQQDFIIGPNGLVNQFQQFPQQIQTAFGTGMGQLFQSPGFTGFGQSFQQFPGGGAVGSGTNDPLGFLNQQLGGFGLFNPFQGVTPTTGAPGGVTAPGTGVGEGTGGVGCDVCGAIRSLGTGGGFGGGGGIGGGGVPSTGGGFGGGGPGEPSFIGGGGGIGAPIGGGAPTGGGGGETLFRVQNKGANEDPSTWRAVQMRDDPTKWKVVDQNGINVADMFPSQQAAEQYIQIHQSGGNTSGGMLPPTGGTPGGGIPTGGGGGGGIPTAPGTGGGGGIPGPGTGVAPAEDTVQVFNTSGNIINVPIDDIQLYPIGQSTDPSGWGAVIGGQAGQYNWIWVSHNGQAHPNGQPVTPVTFPSGNEVAKFVEFYINHPGRNSTGPGAAPTTPGTGTLPPGQIPGPTGGGNQQIPGTGGGFGQPTGGMQTGGGRAVAIAGGGMLGGAPIPGQQPGFGMPIGTPPVPPRIVQEAGLPSQHIDVNQDPTTWQIVESAGLVGTYDIIDDNGDVVQLGFRTLRDAEVYLNYFISYYQWVKSGSTGIPGPVPVGGGMGGVGGGAGGVGGIPGGVGGVPGAGFGGGVTATAGGAQASAGGGGAFAQAGGAMASAGGFLGGAQGPKIPTGPTQEPEAPFEPIPRPQGPFRHGQDNQEPIYDNSGIKIGADFGSPGDETVTMEDIEEGGGTGGGSSRSRRRRRIEDHISRAIAIAGGVGNAPPWIQQFLAEMKQMFSDWMINVTLNNMIDGNMLNRSMGKYQLKKVSVFT